MARYFCGTSDTSITNDLSDTNDTSDTNYK